MASTGRPSRRVFLQASTCSALMAAGSANWSTMTNRANGAESVVSHLSTDRRIGAVAYGYQYSIGLFAYRNRKGPRMDARQFVEATRKAGGNVAQIYHTMVTSLDDAQLKRLRSTAEELDVVLEVHGGNALNPKYEQSMQVAAKLGSKIVGCSFGMLMRPDKIATLKAWDEHTARCLDRLRGLARVAQSLGLTIGVENHLDFTVEELDDLIRKTNSPHVGVLFDVGNTIGTLDDPIEAADRLGPRVVATHYKDFAVEEVARGFRFTMVPLGAGSLRLPEITERLAKHIGPDVNFSIEMISGQHFEVKWLEDRFWTAYRHKPGREVAATLRHIRSKAIDLHECIPVEEFDKLPHNRRVALEQDRMIRCISHLKAVVGAIGGD